MFIKENLNPKNRKTGDCVIRAIAKAEDRTWDEVFDSLVEIAKKWKTVPNHKDCYGRYLDNCCEKIIKFDDMMYQDENGKHRLTVKQFSEKYSKGAYVLKLANHLTCVVDGTVYDLGDWCLSSCPYTAWKIK